MNRFDLLNKVNNVESLLGGIIGNNQHPSVKHVVKLLYDASLKAITLEDMDAVMKRIDTILNKEPEELMNILRNLRRESEEKIQDEEVQEYIEEKKEELAADRRLDEIQENSLENEYDKDDLFVLVQNNGNFKLQDREAIMKNKMDRQRNVFERNLKLLEALEAIREVSKKTDGLLKLDLKNMMDLPENEFELQKKLLSRFKLKAMSTKGVEMDRETPEREISLETITREDLENEDITYAISFKELQSKEWELLSEKFRSQMKEHLKAKDIEVEDREPLSIEDDVLNAIAGKEENQMSGKNKDDDYGQEL